MNSEILDTLRLPGDLNLPGISCMFALKYPYQIYEMPYCEASGVTAWVM